MKYMRSPLTDKWKAEAQYKFNFRMGLIVGLAFVIAIYFVSENLASRGF